MTGPLPRATDVSIVLAAHTQGRGAAPMPRSHRRAFVVLAVTALSGLTALPAQAGQGAPLTAGPAGGIVPTREAGGHGAPAGRGGSVKLLTWHGGPVMSSGAVVAPIFWGPKWATDTTFAAAKVAGLET